MIFSNVSAGIVGMSVRANPLELPKDPSFADLAGGVVVVGGTALGGGKFRRTSPVMVVEIPTSTATRLKVASSEDATAKITLLSGSSAAVGSGTLSPIARALGGNAWITVNWVPFTANTRVVHSPIPLSQGIGQVVSGIPLPAFTASDSVMSLFKAHFASVANTRLDMTNRAFSVTPVGWYLGIALATGQLDSVVSDVVSKLLNLSAMASYGTPGYAYGENGNGRVTYSQTYKGAAWSRYIGGDVGVSIPAIEVYAENLQFSSYSQAANSMWLVVRGDAASDLISIQKGI